MTTTEEVAATNRRALAGQLFETYRDAVGGMAVGGNPIPTWDAVTKDPSKEHVVEGWEAVAIAADERLGDLQDRVASLTSERLRLRRKAEANARTEPLSWLENMQLADACAQVLARYRKDSVFWRTQYPGDPVSNTGLIGAVNAIRALWKRADLSQRLTIATRVWLWTRPNVPTEPEIRAYYDRLAKRWQPQKGAA